LEAFVNANAVSIFFSVETRSQLLIKFLQKRLTKGSFSFGSDVQKTATSEL
jgi:hypothetical protein